MSLGSLMLAETLGRSRASGHPVSCCRIPWLDFPAGRIYSRPGTDFCRTGASIDQRYHAATAFLKGIDPDWAGAIDRIGPCTHDPKAAREPYEALIRAIGYQQLTARASDAIIGRLKALHPESPFPTPEEILATGFDRMRACGFSAAKIATIQAIAEGSLTGLVPTRDVAAAMDDEELIGRLVALRGVGRWTVEMLLIYTLERPDVLPVDDFGVREGYRALKSLDVAPKPRLLREIGAAWSPYRTVAAWYLWRVPRAAAS